MKNKIINIDPEIMCGTPVFMGTRVPIENLFDYIETGETLEEFLDDFPSVKREQAIQLLNAGLKLLVSNKSRNENSTRRVHSAKTKKRLKGV